MSFGVFQIIFIISVLFLYIFYLEITTSVSQMKIQKKKPMYSEHFSISNDTFGLKKYIY